MIYYVTLLDRTGRLIVRYNVNKQAMLEQNIESSTDIWSDLIWK